MDGRWNDAALDAMRALGDPTADDTIRRLIEERGIETSRQLFSALSAPPGGGADGLAPPCAAYFRGTCELPTWADPAPIRVAQRFFEDNGFRILMLLACSSLPSSLAARRGVQVLYRTGKLQNDVRRRLRDTSQLVIDVMRDGGLTPGGCGIRYAQRVRLLHAAIRHHLLTGPEPWSDELGVPINQEDLAGTLMSFSALVLGGMEKLGTPATAEQAEAYIHTWNVVGFLVGVRPELLPRDAADAQALMKAIARRQYAPSEEGRALMRTLLAMLQENTPGRAFDGLSVAMIRYFVGEETAAILGLPENDWTEHIFRYGMDLGRGLKVLQDLAPPVGAAVRRLGVAHAYGVRLLDQKGSRRVAGVSP